MCKLGISAESAQRCTLYKVNNACTIKWSLNILNTMKILPRFVELLALTHVLKEFWNAVEITANEMDIPSVYRARNASILHQGTGMV
jgi:hypothetical protein